MSFGYTADEFANCMQSLFSSINASNAAATMSIYDSMRCNCDTQQNVGFLASVPEPCRPNSLLYRGVCEDYYEPQKKRLRCEYCGCLSEKDYGTCEHCGAPL